MKLKNKFVIFGILGAIFMSACNVSNDKSSSEQSIIVEPTVENIMENIEKIGEVGEESGKLIDAISDAFVKLTLSEKKQVNNVQKLWDAQKQYAMRNGFVKGEFDETNIVSTFGVVSDLHNSNNIPSSLEILKAWDDGRGIDALVMAGDLTDGVRYYQTGESEIKKFKNMILNNIPETMPIVMTLGNHDTSNGSFTSLFYDVLGPRFYSNIDNQELARNKGLSHSIVCGYDFICLECDFETVANEGITKDAEKFLEEQMEQIVNRADYDGRYIFIVNHLIPYNTLERYSNSTKINEILRYYPQAVVIAGHSHTPVHDPLQIDQNRFTTFNPGSVSWMDCGGGYITTSSTHVITGEGYTSYSLPNGIVMEIDKNGNIRFNRLDLRQPDLLIDEPWIISSPKNNNSHLCSYTKDRKSEKFNKLPYFESDDIHPLTTYEIPKASPNRKDVTITIDAAKDDDGFIYSYSLSLFSNNGALLFEGSALSEFFLYCDKTTMPDRFKFTVPLLTDLPAKLVIKPVDSVRATGKEITVNLIYTVY